MPRSAQLQEIIEKAVSEVLDAALPGLRVEVSRRTAEAVRSLVTDNGVSATEKLGSAINSIQECGTQAEILRHLVQGGASFAGRLALFVVKAGTVTGWMGTGFTDDDSIKNISLNGASPLLAQAMQDRTMAQGSAKDFDPAFMKSVGNPSDPTVVAIPLVVRDKVAAVIYADGGARAGAALDVAALASLTKFAGLWVELNALRKNLSAHAPVEEPTVATPVATQPVAAAAVAPATEPSELHKKARRFAKLLVEEIRLYNQPKVDEGRQHRDLYARLKVDIEKSRATYDKRYAESAVASADYFNQELVRVLANNDVALMGNGFPRN